MKKITIRELAKREWSEMPYKISYRGVSYYYNSDLKSYFDNFSDFSYYNEFRFSAKQLDDEIEIRKEEKGVFYEQGYMSEFDRTVIFKDTYDDYDNLISCEVVGWYFGEPDENGLETFKNGNLKATFDM